MSTTAATQPMHGDELSERLRQATLGRYDIYAELGRGGMAAVYLALDLALNRKVALKVMLPELVQGLGAYERFRREARTAAALSHPHIIPVYAVGDDEHLAWFAMKYVDGRPLDSVLAEEGAQNPAFVQTMLRQVGSALEYAHRRGVVHRDIKPANILLDEGGWFILTDFGIAKATDDVGLTSSGMLIGTPAYMSPEHFEGKAIGPAADQYALGCVAYELLAGRRLFECATVAELMRSHMLDTPLPIVQVRRDCPDTLARVITRTLEKDPGQRFAAADDLVHALDPSSPDEQRQVNTQITMLARSGAEHRPRISQPVSPVPVNRAAIDVSPVKHSGVRDSDATATLRLGKSIAVLALGLTALGAWWTIRPSTIPGNKADSAAAVETSTTPPPVASPASSADSLRLFNSSPQQKREGEAQQPRSAVRAGTVGERAVPQSAGGENTLKRTSGNVTPTIPREAGVAESTIASAVASMSPMLAQSDSAIRTEAATPTAQSWFSIKLLFRDLTLYVDRRLVRVEKQRTVVVPISPGRHVIEVRRNECPSSFIDDRVFVAGDTVRYNNKGPCPES